MKCGIKRSTFHKDENAENSTVKTLDEFLTKKSKERKGFFKPTSNSKKQKVADVDDIGDDESETSYSGNKKKSKIPLLLKNTVAINVGVISNSERNDSLSIIRLLEVAAYL